MDTLSDSQFKMDKRTIISFIFLIFLLKLGSAGQVTCSKEEEKIEDYCLKGEIIRAEITTTKVFNFLLSKEEEIKILNAEIKKGYVRFPSGKINIENNEKTCKVKLIPLPYTNILIINQEVGITFYKENIAYSCDNNKISVADSFIKNMYILEREPPAHIIYKSDTITKKFEMYFEGIKKEIGKVFIWVMIENGKLREFSYLWGNFNNLSGKMIFPSEGWLSFYATSLRFQNETFVEIENNILIIEKKKPFYLNEKFIRSEEPVRIQIYEDKIFGYSSRINTKNTEFDGAKVDGEIIINSIGWDLFNNKIFLKKGTLRYLDENLIIRGENMFLFEYNEILMSQFNSGKILLNKEKKEYKDFKKEGFQAIGIDGGIILSDNANVDVDINGVRIVMEKGKPKVYPKSKTKPKPEIKKLIAEYQIEIDGNGKITAKKEKREVTIIDMNKYLASPAIEKINSFYKKKVEPPQIRPLFGGSGGYSPVDDIIFLSSKYYGLSAKKEEGAPSMDIILAHEAAHAIWNKYLNKKQKDSFRQSLFSFLEKENLESEKIKKILNSKGTSYDIYKNNLEMRKEYEKQTKGYPVEVIEGWAFIAQFIYENCEGISDYKFPASILQNYRGIIREECLEKARENE